jgi:nucleoside-diphosphate-sugar epimerase
MNSGEPGLPGPRARKIVILGAGGYLGSSLCRFFHGLPGYAVAALFRGEPNHRFFDDVIIADALTGDWAARIASAGIYALINCAFDFSAIGTRDLAAKYAVFDGNLATLRRSGAARLLNISSMSAYPGCRTDYGREKLFVEGLFRKYDGLSVRPGLIASWNRPGAAMLRLIDITTSSKVIPLLQAKNSGFYVCDLEAVVLGLFLLLNLQLNKPHTLSFCYRGRLSLAKIVALIEARYRTFRPKVPVPWLAAYLALRAKETVAGKSKVRADSILDFAYPAPFAERREVFARLVDYFHGGLELPGRAEGMPRGFYFLEGSADRTTGRPCRVRSELDADVLTALGRLADA